MSGKSGGGAAAVAEPEVAGEVSTDPLEYAAKQTAAVKADGNDGKQGNDGKPAAPVTESKPAGVKDAATSADEGEIEPAIKLPGAKDGVTKDAADSGKPGADGQGAVAPAGGYEPPVMPQGFALDEKLLEQVSPLLATAKDKGLGQEWFQGLVDKFAAHVATQQSALLKDQEDGYRTQQREYQETLRKDPEWGGGQFERTRELAGVGLQHLFGDGAREVYGALELTGLINHPQVVKGFARLGKMHSERPAVLGDNVGLPTNVSAAEVVYPGMKPGK